MGMGKVTRTSQGISALFKFQINAVLGGIIKVLKYRQKKKKLYQLKCHGLWENPAAQNGKA